VGLSDYLERDRDEPERLAPDRDELPFERVEPDFAEPDRDELAFVRDELARVREELAFVRVEPAFERDELAFERVEPDFDPLDERERLDAEPDLAREVDFRELLELPFDELRELLDERRELERRVLDPPLRSAAGISSRATAFASCGICFSRNLAIRSSSRRMPRASFAVSLSPTLSASASMPV
jgi:hypothetical protein